MLVVRRAQHNAPIAGQHFQCGDGFVNQPELERLSRVVVERGRETGWRYACSVRSRPPRWRADRQARPTAASSFRRKWCSHRRAIEKRPAHRVMAGDVTLADRYLEQMSAAV